VKAYDPIKDLLPKEGWLKTYYDYIGDTELCERFTLFSALVTVGALIDNKVSWTRVKGLFRPLYPNPWAIMIGPAGRGHKTSAVDFAEDLLYEINPNCKPKILSEKITPEAVVRFLTVEKPSNKKVTITLRRPDSTGLILAPELAVFLGKQHYNTGMVTLLTRLYDCPKRWSADIITRGLAPLKNVCLSILGASTPKWLGTMMPEEVYTGGFMSRFNLVLLPEHFDKRIWEPKKPEPALRSKIKKGMEAFSNLEGEMKLTSEANKWMTKWYEESPREREHEEILEAFYSRKPEHILRLAMLLEVTGIGKLTDIGLHSLETSLQIIELLEDQTRTFLGQHTGDLRTEDVQKVLEILRKPQFKGRLSRQALISKCFRYLPGKTSQFDEVIRVLKEGGHIRESPKGDKKLDIWYQVTGTGRTFSFREEEKKNESNRST